MKNIRPLHVVAALAAFSIGTTAFAQVAVQNEVVKPNGRVKVRERVYNGINQTPWYSVPAVQQQLNFTDDQYRQLNSSYNTAWTKYNTGVTQLGDNLTDAQRAQQMSQLNGNFYNTWNQSSTGIIVDPTARQRFNQLGWQYQQYGAFNDPVVRQQLNLTDAQVQKFREYDQNWNRDMATWHNDYANNRSAVERNFTKAQQEFQTNVNTVLTPEQRQQWQSMIGKPYNFTPDVYYRNDQVTTSKPVLK